MDDLSQLFADLNMSPAEEARLLAESRKQDDAEDAELARRLMAFYNALLIDDDALTDDDYDRLFRVMKDNKYGLADILDKITTALMA